MNSISFVHLIQPYLICYEDYEDTDTVEIQYGSIEVSGVVRHDRYCITVGRNRNKHNWEMQQTAFLNFE